MRSADVTAAFRAFQVGGGFFVARPLALRFRTLRPVKVEEYGSKLDAVAFDAAIRPL